MHRLILRIFAATAGVLVLPSCVGYAPNVIDPAITAIALEKRRLDQPALRDFLELEGIRCGQWPLRRWGFEQLAAAGRFFQPDLGVLRAKAETARAALTTAGERPNPVLSMKPGYNSSTKGITPWILEPGLDFTIETAGKRGKRQAEALARLRSARLSVATAEWKSRGEIRKAFLALQGAEEVKTKLNKQARIESDAGRMLEEQVKLGGASVQEEGKLRVIHQQSRLTLHDAEMTAEKSRAALAAAVGVPVAAFHGIVFVFTDPSDSPAPLSSTGARRRALSNRSDILGALSDYAASDEKLRLEIAKQYPDLHVGPSYKMDQTSNKWTLGVGLELPVMNQHRGAMMEAEKGRTEAEAQFLAVQMKAIGEIDNATAVYRAARDKLAAAEGLVHAVKSVTASVSRQQEAGDLSPLELAQRKIEEGVSELTLTSAHQQFLEAMGALEDALQTPVSQWK